MNTWITCLSESAWWGIAGILVTVICSAFPLLKWLRKKKDVTPNDAMEINDILTGANVVNKTTISNNTNSDIVIGTKIINHSMEDKTTHRDLASLLNAMQEYERIIPWCQATGYTNALANATLDVRAKASLLLPTSYGDSAQNCLDFVNKYKGMEFQKDEALENLKRNARDEIIPLISNLELDVNAARNR